MDRRARRRCRPIVNELYDAIRATYSPTFASEPDCHATGHCIIGNNYTQGGYFWFVPQNHAVMFVNNTPAPQPAASTITLVDLGLLKLLPFSLGNNSMKLDHGGEGPLVTTPNVATSGSTGVYKLGMTSGRLRQAVPRAVPAGNVNNTIAKKQALRRHRPQ